MKVYSTNDDAGLVWTDPEIFKRFAIGPLIAHAKTPEELKEAYVSYAGMSADDLVNHRDTAGTYSVEDLSEDDLNKRLSDPEVSNNFSLRDLYEFDDDTDPFGKDLYDFLDSTMPERDIPEEEKAALEEPEDESEDESEEATDVNDDGDIDVVAKDIDNDGTADETTVIADSEKEAEDATSKAASEMDVEPSIKDTMIDVAKKAAKQQMKDEADKEIIDKDISDDLSDLLSSEMDSTGNLKLSGNILNALRDIRF